MPWSVNEREKKKVLNEYQLNSMTFSKLCLLTNFKVEGAESEERESEEREREREGERERGTQKQGRL